MGKKKRKQEKPWCFYCDREFADEKVLVQHQQAKHFKCPHCSKRMSSATSLSTHCLHVHKEPLDKVPNAKATRDSVEYEIFGMDGIPEEVWKEHRAMKGEADDDSDDESGGNKKPKQGEAAASSAAAYPSYGAPYGYTGYPPFSGYPPMSYPAYPYSGYPQPYGMPNPYAYPPNPYGMPPPPPHMPLPPYPGALGMPPIPPIPAPIPPLPPAPSSSSIPIPIPPPPSIQTPPSGSGSGSGVAPAFPPSSNGLLPAPPASSSSTATSSAPVPTVLEPGVPQVLLIYDDESMSMEERRAMAAKYKVEAAK